MTTTKDVRDMLGVTADQVVPRPKPSKKKPKTTLPRPDGITRELYALMGERAPPIPIATKPKFKAKLARNTVPSKWRWTPFINEARDDDLRLGHWRKEDPVIAQQTQPQQTASNPEPITQQHQADSNGDQKMDTTSDSTPKEPESLHASQPKDENAQPSSHDSRSPALQKQYPFVKYNVQIPKLEYSDSEYETHLKTEGWSKEETDYLVDLVSACYQKWPVIQDRYDYKPAQSQPENPESTELVPVGKERSLEELKMRYYTVSAKILELRIPLEKMTADELSNHEKMQKFNPAQEITRKRLKEALLHRSIDEKREEEYLLAELKRIWTHQQRFSTELRDLRQRLDHSLTDEPADFQPLTNSQAINNVFQKVFQNRDKGKMQRRSITGEPNGLSPATGAPHALNTAAAQAAASGSATNTPTTAGTKKGATTANSALNQNHRLVSPRHEPRFGITTHERLTGGITFRSDKLTKARQAKSLTQTQKIAAVLAELSVPDLLQMPTVPVCEAMESLISKVNLLIDARRVREKEENELKVANHQLETKTGIPSGNEPTKEDGSGETKTEGEEDGQKQQEPQTNAEQPKTEDGDRETQDVSMTDAPAEDTADSSRKDNEAEPDDQVRGADVKEDADANDDALIDEEDEEKGEEEEEAVAEDEEDETTLNQDADVDGSEDNAEEELDENDVDENGSIQDEDEEDPSELVDLDEEDEEGDVNEPDLDVADGDNDEEVEAGDPEEDDEEGAENEEEEEQEGEEEDNEEEIEDVENDEEPPSSPPGVSSPAPSVGRPATRNGSTSAAQTPTASATLGVNTRTRGKRSASVLSAASSASNAGPSAGVRRGDRKRARR